MPMSNKKQAHAFKVGEFVLVIGNQKIDPHNIALNSIAKITALLDYGQIPSFSPLSGEDLITPSYRILGARKNCLANPLREDVLSSQWVFEYCLQRRSSDEST